MPDADLVVEVPIEATPAEVVDKVITQEVEPKPAPLPAIEPVEDLKRQFETLSRAKEADAAASREAIRKANDEAKAAQDQLAKANTELVESNVSAVESAIAASKAEADGFQQQQQLAYENGDFAKAAEYGRKMARAEAKIDRLEEGKENLEAARVEKPKPATEAPRAQEPAPPTDPFERAIANTSDRAKVWLRAHPEYVTNQDKAYDAQIADIKAVKSGLARDTDAYFDFCERELGLKEAPKTEPRQPEARTAAMPAAPVTHASSPSGGQMTSTQVKLTPGEVRAATDGTVVWNYTDPKTGAVKNTPVGLKEYARRKMEMTKEGRYGVLSDS